MKKIIIVIGLVIVAVAMAIVVAKPSTKLVVTEEMNQFLDKGIGFVDRVKKDSITIEEKGGSVTYSITPDTKIINTFSKSIKSAQDGQAVVLSLVPGENKVVAISLVDSIVKEMVDSEYVVFGTVVTTDANTITIVGLDGKEKTLTLNQGVSLASQSEYDLENVVQGQKVTIVSHVNEQGELVADVVSITE
jgi:hypothetical protein